MNVEGAAVAMVAVWLGLAPLGCTKDGGQGASEAGAPSNGSTCGGGAVAVAELDPLPAAAAPGGTDSGVATPIVGQATFTATGDGVDLTIAITSCASGTLYPVVIHEGTACSSAMLRGPDWDAPRGDGIVGLACTNSGVSRLYYSRPSSDPKPWSLGAPSSSDVMGHVLVIADPATMQPLACGAIVAAPEDAGASTATSSSEAGALPPVDVRAQLAGLCLYRMQSPTGQCPDPQKLSDCACEHCNLSACLGPCAGYAKCLESTSDAGCATSCPMDPNCSDCTSEMFACLLGFCPDVVGCAVPTPGGPCSKLEACCAMQGPRAQGCLGLIHELEKVGGDTTCLGTMNDQDFLTHEAYDPPCNFDQ